MDRLVLSDAQWDRISGLMAACDPQDHLRRHARARHARRPHALNTTPASKWPGYSTGKM